MIDFSLNNSLGSHFLFLNEFGSNHRPVSIRIYHSLDETLRQKSIDQCCEQLCQSVQSSIEISHNCLRFLVSLLFYSPPRVGRKIVFILGRQTSPKQTMNVHKLFSTLYKSSNSLWKNSCFRERNGSLTNSKEVKKK